MSPRAGGSAGSIRANRGIAGLAFGGYQHDKASLSVAESRILREQQGDPANAQADRAAIPRGPSDGRSQARPVSAQIVRDLFGLDLWP